MVDEEKYGNESLKYLINYEIKFFIIKIFNTPIKEIYLALISLLLEIIKYLYSRYKTIFFLKCHRSYNERFAE